ncbi:MAG: Hsp33 family molecular chaperone HslO, partial [Clostridiaceae bacterium]
VSEQLPSAVALGVLVGGEGKVLQSGGFLIQMMPGHSEELADKLSEIIEKLPPITTLLNEYNDLTEILKNIFSDFDLKINEILATDYHCDCSREKVEKALLSIGLTDLTELYEDNKTETLTCHFCNKKYDFSHENIGKLIEEAKQ